MKAVVVNKNSKANIEVVEKELRPLHSGEALVDVEYCGFVILIYTLQIMILETQMAVFLVMRV